MQRVTFKFNNGKERAMLKIQAEFLERRGLGYLSRDMADQPKVIKQPDMGNPISQVTDDLDAMDKAQLHALAKERGLQLHHMLGADKVRAALRGTE
jgi:hypothetical protein